MWGGGSSISIELITVIDGDTQYSSFNDPASLHHFWAHPKHDHTEDQHAQTHTPPSYPSRIESMHLLESAGEDAGQLVDCRLCGCLVHLLAHSLRHVAVHLSGRLHTGRRSSSSRATVHNNTHTYTGCGSVHCVHCVDMIGLRSVYTHRITPVISRNIIQSIDRTNWTLLQAASDGPKLLSLLQPNSGNLSHNFPSSL